MSDDVRFPGSSEVVQKLTNNCPALAPGVELRPRFNQLWLCLSFHGPNSGHICPTSISISRTLVHSGPTSTQIGRFRRNLAELCPSWGKLGAYSAQFHRCLPAAGQISRKFGSTRPMLVPGKSLTYCVVGPRIRPGRLRPPIFDEVRPAFREKVSPSLWNHS